MHVCVYICIPHIPLHTMSNMFIAVSVLFIYLYIYQDGLSGWFIMYVYV